MLRKADGTFMVADFNSNQFTTFPVAEQIGPEWQMLL
jgi:hypothetical protein